MPLPIGLDARMIRHSGIGTYLRGLLSGFRELSGLQNVKPVLFGPRSIAADYPDFLVEPFSAPIYSLSEQCAYFSRVSQCGLWHAPHYNVPVFHRKAKLVVTVHDLIHWIFRKDFLNAPKRAYAEFMLKRAVGSADLIIAVSHHTKRDLVSHLGVPEQKITVIHEGVGNTYRELPPEELDDRFEVLKQKYALPDRFFLYVGLMKPHKNVLWLIRHFQKLKNERKIQSSLVLVGRKDKQYPKGYEELERFVSTKDIIHLPAVESDELLVLYNQAVALVHPSLYEGFGLTLLEAMQCGTPVISSKAASLPEVAGDAAILVDPRSDTELSEALICVESDRQTWEILRAKGFARVKQFSWKETAMKTAQIYSQLAT